MRSASYLHGKAVLDRLIPAGHKMLRRSDNAVADVMGASPVRVHLHGNRDITAYLAVHKKIRNVRNDPRVAVTVVSPDGPGQAMRPYLAINGTARIVEGGAPELLKDLAQTLLAGPDVKFPPDGAPPGFLTRIRIDKVGGVGPWGV